MITWIGLCAGEVWRFLDKNDGKATLKAIVAGVEAPKETVLMAVGWLAREGYVLIDGNLPNPTVNLNEKPPAKDPK